MDLTRRLHDLLQEPPEAFQARMSRAWSDRVQPGAPLVLFGAGTLGRKLQKVLAGSLYQVVAFSDNDPAKWGTSIHGTTVYSPAEACAMFGQEACFVVSIWRAEGEPHRFQDTEARLRALGARQVAHFGHLAWQHPQGLLPHFSLNHPQRMREAGAQVLEALDCFQEPRSRELFLRHALWRLTLDFELLPPTDPEEIYFPEGLFQARPHEVIVDAGAFDGDTSRRMLQVWGPGLQRIHAFEPDPVNAQKFEDWMVKSPDRSRIRFHPIALGSEETTLSFQGTGTLDSTPLPGGTSGSAIPCKRLDRVLEADPPTFIKMDIEGAEFDALVGAEGLLRRGPRVAICLYHRQDHLWTIPLLLKRWMPKHAFHLRYHGTDAWELVLYSVPPQV